MFIQASEHKRESICAALQKMILRVDVTKVGDVFCTDVQKIQAEVEENLLKSTKTDAEMIHKQINKINSSSHFIFVEFSTLCGSRV